MENELDSRMTNETRIFVENSLKVVRPNNIPSIPIHLSRQAREIGANKIFESVKFENLGVRNFCVKSKIDNYEIPVQAVMPKNARPNSPITVFFHGGGWTFGSAKTHFHSVASIVSLVNTIWLSVDYRLAPEHKFQTQIADCRSVVEWILENKAQFSSHTAKIGVSGDSAGGHYSCILTHEYKSLINYQILIYPCVDLVNTYESNKEFSDEHFILTPVMIDFFVKNFLTDQDDLASPSVSPILNKDFKNMPKCLILAAELDPLIDQIKDYQKKLLENSNESDLKIIKGSIHGFFHNGFQCKEAFTESIQHIAEFFKQI